MNKTVIYLAFVFLLVLDACHHHEEGPPVKAIDVLAVKPDPEIQVMEKGFSESFTGIVPKYYNADSSRLECLLFIENGELKTRYFFDKSQRIQEENHYDYSAMHGIQKRFYPGGHLKESLEMDHGVRNGQHLSYYENGHVKAKETWSKGKRKGPILVYDSLGQFLYKAPHAQYEVLFLK